MEMGYDENNRKGTTIWQSKGDEILVIQQTADSIQSLKTGLKNGKYDGIIYIQKIQCEVRI